MSGYQLWLSLAVVRYADKLTPVAPQLTEFNATGFVRHDDWCLKRRTKKESSTVKSRLIKDKLKPRYVTSVCLYSCMQKLLMPTP